jgi:hypothetical protein
MKSSRKAQVLPITLDDQLDDEKTKGSDQVGRHWKMLFCFVGLQISYVLWGIVQEQLMTQEYKFGKFKSSAFCVSSYCAAKNIIEYIVI